MNPKSLTIPIHSADCPRTGTSTNDETRLADRSKSSFASPAGGRILSTIAESFASACGFCRQLTNDPSNVLRPIAACPRSRSQTEINNLDQSTISAE